MKYRTWARMKVMQNYIFQPRPGVWRVDIEKDLQVIAASHTAMTPIINRRHENIGIWVKCHGSSDGCLFYDDKEVDPRMIRRLVAEKWGNRIPILVTCCFPAAVNRRYAKSMKAYGMCLFDTRIETEIWTSTPESSTLPFAHVWTPEAHEKRHVYEFPRMHVIMKGEQ